MIRETLTAVGQAGRQALVHVASKAKVETQITQVREWSFTMPGLAQVTVANSPIHQVYVGLSRPLATFFERHDSAYETMLEKFKQELVGRVPAKRPIGEWRFLPADGEMRVLRGVRSFIVRQQTAAGNLYLMADVASRCEYETMRQPEWESELADRLLPRDLARDDTVEAPVAVDRLATYLTRCEHDLELLVAGADSNVHACNGVVLGRVKENGTTQLVMSLDIDKDVRPELQPGVELEGSFGSAGRVFRFRTVCAGPESLNLDGDAELPCFRFTLPERFNLDQRRRYFRVQPRAELTARLHVLPPEAAADGGEDPMTRNAKQPGGPPKDAVKAGVEDLSFSGAGLVIEGSGPPELARDGLVQLWIDGEELNQTLELTGLVRRLDTTPRGRGRVRTSVGVEFVVRGSADRQSTQAIRQYVMTQQRHLLSNRSAAVQPV